MGSFTMHLYDGVPDAKLDNVPWAFASANDRAKYLGSIVIGAPAVLGATLYVDNGTPRQAGEARLRVFRPVRRSGLRRRLHAHERRAVQGAAASRQQGLTENLPSGKRRRSRKPGFRELLNPLEVSMFVNSAFFQ
jgi:hypothetical protein